MRGAVTFLVLAVMTPAVASAQGGGMAPTPLVVDLKKASVGAWSEYSMTGGPGSSGGKIRWSLIRRDGDNHVLEMTADGGPATGGQKVALQMTLLPDPTSVPKPVKKMVVQLGSMDPMVMPPDMPGMSGQRFEKPDPKKKVGKGKEQVKVPGGSFATDHYRDVVPQGTIDTWLNDTVLPLGLVKMTLTPKAGATPPGPGATLLELSARGKDAKTSITKEPKPFDPSALGMGGGGHAGPPSSGKPAGQPSTEAPPAAPAPKK